MSVIDDRLRCDIRWNTLPRCGRIVTARIFAGHRDYVGYGGGWRVCGLHLHRVIDKLVADIGERGDNSEIRVYRVDEFEEWLDEPTLRRYSRIGALVARIRPKRRAA